MRNVYVHLTSTVIRFNWMYTMYIGQSICSWWRLTRCDIACTECVAMKMVALRFLRSKIGTSWRSTRLFPSLATLVCTAILSSLAIPCWKVHKNNRVFQLSCVVHDIDGNSCPWKCQGQSGITVLSLKDERASKQNSHDLETSSWWCVTFFKLLLHDVTQAVDWFLLESCDDFTRKVWEPQSPGHFACGCLRMVPLWRMQLFRMRAD